MPQGNGIHKCIQYLSEIFLAVPELPRLVKTVFVALSCPGKTGNPDTGAELKIRCLL